MTRSRALSPRACAALVLIAALTPASVTAQSGATFIRGDANVDGDRNITDAVYLLGCSFLGTECPSCGDAGDLDDDGMLNITDPVYLLNFLFSGGPAPPAPFDACGPDPTGDELACAEFARCVEGGGGDTIPAPEGGAVTVVPIEHATLALLWNEKTIYVDPVGGATPFRELPPPDIILVTDVHGDHMDGATIRAVAVEGTSLVVPAAVSQSLAGNIGKATEVILANGETKDVEGIPILGVPMYNLTPDRLRYHAKGRGNGYVIDLGGARVYVSGDTEDIPEMRALTGISAAFLCMNLPFTMTPAQAASAVLEFRPEIVYPYHYSGQRPEDFQTLVEAGSKEIEVRIRDWYP